MTSYRFQTKLKQDKWPFLSRTIIAKRHRQASRCNTISVYNNPLCVTSSRVNVGYIYTYPDCLHLGGLTSRCQAPEQYPNNALQACVHYRTIYYFIRPGILLPSGWFWFINDICQSWHIFCFPFRSKHNTYLYIFGWRLWALRITNAWHPLSKTPRKIIIDYYILHISHNKRSRILKRLQNEPRREKTGFLARRKQRRRSASR